MSKRKYTVVQVLDPEEVSGYSDAQKAHYISLGYMPCLLANGSTKWLTESQRVIRTVTANHPFFKFSGRLKRAPKRRARRRHRSQVQKFVIQNWPFIVTLSALFLALWLLLVYWNAFFG